MISDVLIQTRDGVADSHVCVPDGAGPFPGVLLYMDGIGIRPDLLSLGEYLAQHGFLTLVPNLFYRDGPAEAADLSTMLSPGPENDRMMARVMGLTGEQVMRDTTAFLGFLDQDARYRGPRVATIGYCMGGSKSLLAAGTYPDRVVAAASVHGAGLASVHPGSPHLLAGRMRGKIYVAVAGIDPWLADGETALLKQTFDASGVDYTLEEYPGAVHGFALPGLPISDEDAAARVWSRVLPLFAAALA